MALLAFIAALAAAILFLVEFFRSNFGLTNLGLFFLALVFVIQLWPASG